MLTFPFSSLWPNNSRRAYHTSTRTPEQQNEYDRMIAQIAAPETQTDADIIRDEVRKPPPPMFRPGSTPPKAYINNTREILNKAMDKHTDELLALDKDIEKLTEERRQCRIALDGMQAALTHMSAADPSVVPPTQAEMDATTLAALKLNLDDGAE